MGPLALGRALVTKIRRDMACLSNKRKFAPSYARDGGEYTLLRVLEHPWGIILTTLGTDFDLKVVQGWVVLVQMAYTTRAIGDGTARPTEPATAATAERTQIKRQKETKRESSL